MDARHTDKVVEKVVSADAPDWTREEVQRFWDPSRKLLLSIRRYQHWHSKGGLVAALICKCVCASPSLLERGDGCRYSSYL